MMKGKKDIGDVPVRHGRPPVQGVPVGKKILLCQGDRFGHVGGAGGKQDQGSPAYIGLSAQRKTRRESLSLCDQSWKSILNTEQRDIGKAIAQGLKPFHPGAGDKNG